MPGPDGSGLRARIVVRRDRLTVDVALTAAPGEVVAVLGPNAAGKTTALRALAGLQPLDGGYVRLGGAAWDDPAARTFVPAERRPVGVVFQDYLLFPHLSAVDNVAFGLRCRGVPRHAARVRASDWLDRVGLAGLADARPAALSGGQAQRVALARALAVAPRVLLLDEPLAALDARTRADVRSVLRRHLVGFTGCAVLVTHDPLDAMVLADRLVVVEDGLVVQEGEPAAVARRPRTPYVARLVGLNLLSGRAAGHRVTVADGAEVVTADPASGAVFVAFRPAAVSVHRRRPEGSPRNVWPGTVTAAEPSGSVVRLSVDGPVPLAADVSPAAVAELGLAEGVAVFTAVKATEVEVYPV